MIFRLKYFIDVLCGKKKSWHFFLLGLKMCFVFLCF